MRTIKTITSKDGKQCLDIEVTEAGLYRYTIFSDRYRMDEDFQDPPYWTMENHSGLYETADEAEADAKSEFAWLRE